MPTHTWVFDAPSGVYKNNALSAQLYEAAIEDTVAMDFVQPVNGYGRKRGESVTLTRIKNVTEPTSATLDENIRIPEDEFDISTKDITVSEIGRAIPFSSLSEDLSHFDLENAIQRKLRQQMALYLDTLALAAYKSTLITCQLSAADTTVFTETGTFAGAAAVNLDAGHMGQIRDRLYDNYYAEPVEGGDYVGIFRTKAIRGLKDDSNWEKWHFYIDPAAKFNSEIGRFEQIRVIETNHGNSTVGGYGLATGSTAGEGVVFGADAVAMAEAVSPELRVAMAQDFGRSRAVAWYGVLAFDTIWGTANAGEAKIIRVGGSSL